VVVWKYIMFTMMCMEIMKSTKKFHDNNIIKTYYVNAMSIRAHNYYCTNIIGMMQVFTHIICTRLTKRDCIIYNICVMSAIPNTVPATYYVQICKRHVPISIRTILSPFKIIVLLYIIYNLMCDYSE
jgi:hypothetical protein